MARRTAEHAALDQANALWNRATADMRSARRSLGGAFFTYDCIDGFNQDCDLVFVGPKPVVYIGTLDTSWREFNGALHAEASRRLERLVGPKDYGEHAYRPMPDGNYQLVTVREPVQRVVGGLDEDAWVSREVEHVAAEGKLAVHEMVRLKCDQPHRIGLDGVVDVPVLTAPVIGDWVRRFLADPKAYTDPRGIRFTLPQMQEWWRRVRGQQEGFRERIFGHAGHHRSAVLQMVKDACAEAERQRRR